MWGSRGQFSVKEPRGSAAPGTAGVIPVQHRRDGDGDGDGPSVALPAAPRVAAEPGVSVCQREGDGSIHSHSGGTFLLWAQDLREVRLGQPDPVVWLTARDVWLEGSNPSLNWFSVQLFVLVHSISVYTVLRFMQYCGALLLVTQCCRCCRSVVLLKSNPRTAQCPLCSSGCAGVAFRQC